MEKNKIRNMSDLRLETARVRKSIKNKEHGLSYDFWQVVESVTPMRIITGITSKLVSSAPAIYTAYSIIRTLFGKKK
jgi:hypothetical protein